jgi:hypothetical protein
LGKEGKGMKEVTETPQIELEQALKIVETVAALRLGGADAALPTPFQAGYQLACEEIAHRLCAKDKA